MNYLHRIAPGLFVALWATGFIGARYAMPWAEPFLFLFVRFAIAFAILAALTAAIRTAALRPRPRQILHSMFVGCLIHGVYLGGVFWAIKHGMPAGLSALIVGLQPLITAFMAAVFLRDTVTARQWAGLAIGFSGVALVLQPAFGTAGQVTPATLFSAVLAVVGMSAGTIWQKRHAGDIDLLSGTIFQYLGAALLMSALATAFEVPVYTLTGELVFAMVWLVFVLSIGAIFLLMVLIREGEVAKVASLFYLVPGVTAVLAWILFAEDLAPVQIAGMVVAAAGVAFATSGSRTTPVRPR